MTFRRWSEHRDLSGMALQLKDEYVRLQTEAARLLTSHTNTGPITSIDLQAEAGTLMRRVAALEQALAVLESSRTLERVANLRSKLHDLRKQSDEIDKRMLKNKGLSDRYKDVAAAIKRVSGEMMDERLAELSPLLCELYSRLRPQVDWTENLLSHSGRCSPLPELARKQ